MTDTLDAEAARVQRQQHVQNELQQAQFELDTITRLAREYTLAKDRVRHLQQQLQDNARDDEGEA